MGKLKNVKATTKSIDNYLSKVSAEQRVALEKLRRSIKATAPKAEECIAYQLPSFRLNGKYLVSFAAWKSHCAFYPGSRAIEMHLSALKGYDIDKGTIRFPTSKPLPAALVRKLVRCRIAQIVA